MQTRTELQELQDEQQTKANSNLPFRRGLLGKEIKKYAKRQIWFEQNKNKIAFCKCGCNKIIEIKIHHCNNGIPKYKPGHSPNLKEWRIKQPEEYKNNQIQAGKCMHLKHPCLISRIMKKRLEENPDFLSRITKNTHKKYPWLAKRNGHNGGILRHTKYKDKNKKRYYEIQRLAGKKGGKAVQLKYPCLMSDNIKKMHKKLKIEKPKLYSKRQRYASIKNIEKQTDNGFVSKPEKMMNKILVDFFIHGKKFGKCVPDFRDPTNKKIVEVDGLYWHNIPENKVHDKLKDEYYKKRGYEVYRITDKEVYELVDVLNKKIGFNIFA